MDEVSEAEKKKKEQINQDHTNRGKVKISNQTSIQNPSHTDMSIL